MVIHKVGRVIPEKERQWSYMNYIMGGFQTLDQILLHEKMSDLIKILEGDKNVSK